MPDDSASAPFSSAAAHAEVLAYHARSKHRRERYAAGPETLDWSAQPDPFRHWEGSERIMLAQPDLAAGPDWSRLCLPGGVPPQALDLDAIGTLLALSFGIAAWKELGPDRWAVRCNPSSGNLHPSEVWLICRHIPGLDDGLYHYAPREHALECRARFAPAAPGIAELYVALSSVHWREAWKYGERAFRYCQLDSGHALGALRYAAALLGWETRPVALSHAELMHGLGLDRDTDFPGKAEREDAEWLCALGPQALASAAAALPNAADRPQWFGRANRLDRYPMYRWPAIDAVAAATCFPTPPPAAAAAPVELPVRDLASGGPSAASLLRARRSAQRFERDTRLPLADFYRLLDALLPRPAQLPWDVWPQPVRVHPLLFVHRVDGLEPGLYALPRSPAALATLRTALQADFEWRRPDGCPPHLPLYCLLRGDTQRSARALGCGQAIAGDGMFAVAMLAEFAAPLREAPWTYRTLHQEAGLLGQVLYLEATALGLAGTGIGCFFDDAGHELYGLQDQSLQTVYHFTVGRAVTDARILSLPPYPAPGSAAATPATPHAPETRTMSGERTFQRLTPAEAQQMIAHETELLLLDSRDATDYARGHINGAVHLDGRSISKTLRATAKARPLLIYCYHGNASQTWAQTFADFGFQRVFDLCGGYTAWQAHLADTLLPSPDTRELPFALSAWLELQGFGRTLDAALPGSGVTPLMRACQLGATEIVEALLKLGADVHASNSDGNQALWLACYADAPALIEALVAAGADPDHRNDSGVSTLMYAASAGKTACVERLLALGADPTPESADGFTALDMAANRECLNLLRKARKPNA